MVDGCAAGRGGRLWIRSPQHGPTTPQRRFGRPRWQRRPRWHHRRHAGGTTGGSAGGTTGGSAGGTTGGSAGGTTGGSAGGPAAAPAAAPAAPAAAPAAPAARRRRGRLRPPTARPPRCPRIPTTDWMGYPGVRDLTQVNPTAGLRQGAHGHHAGHVEVLRHHEHPGARRPAGTTRATARAGTSSGSPRLQHDKKYKVLIGRSSCTGGNQSLRAMPRLANVTDGAGGAS